MADFKELIKSPKPTLVDFFATWCKPCKLQAPILEQVKDKLGDSINIIKIDVDSNRDLSGQYSILSVPTLIIFKNGEPIWYGYGLHQADVLEENLRKHINI